ncbi:MAG: hypothetical protein ACXQS8_03035 [Candidatus Helarchaeales archaeon]
MTEVIYPIPAPHRFFLLPIEIMAIGVAFEISAYFLFKYIRNRKNGEPSLIELDWNILFAAFGFILSFYIISDYFAPIEEIRRFWLIFGYISFAIGGVLFSLHVERVKTLHTKYVFTIICAAILASFITISLVLPEYVQYVAYTTFFPVVGILVFYLRKLTRLVRNHYRFYWLGLAGILILFIGYMCTVDLAVETLSIYSRYIGYVAVIIGFVLVGFFFNSMPPTLEIGWEDKIK